MILIAQEGTVFQDIQYLEDKEFLAYDLEAQTIIPIQGSVALRAFMQTNKARLHQQEIVGLELLRLSNIPGGYANILKKGKHCSKEDDYLVKWVFEDTKLKVKASIQEIVLPYMIICNRDIYGYSLDFTLGKRKLISNLPCSVDKELATPLDAAAIFITKVIADSNYELYTISIDVKGISLTTVIAKLHQRVLFADLETHKFVDITELS